MLKVKSPMLNVHQSGTASEAIDILPTFMIPGAAKAGTSYVAHILSQHPDVFLPHIKEPGYFSTDPTEGRHHRGYAYYRKLLAPGRGAKHLGDASSTYLWDPASPKLISQHIPDVKLIVILRNPIERTYSGYWQDIKSGKQLVDFKSGLLDKHWRIGEMVQRSRYDLQLRRYLEFFNREQILILLYDKLSMDPQETIDKMLTFLNLVPLPQDVDVRSRINPAGVPRSRAVARLLRNKKLMGLVRDAVPATWAPKLKKTIDAMRHLNQRDGSYPKMDDETRRHLVEIFRAPVAELSQMLETDLTHWLRT